MALFESYERRIDKINEVLNSYGIASLEEAEKITKDAGLDVYNKIKGIPTTKYQCFVLWRNKYIPAHVPILPPSRLTMNNVRSGIRKRCLIARLLSEYITYNPTMFISSR